MRTLALALMAATVACGSGGGTHAGKPSTSVPTLTLTSPVFATGGAIPRAYTCDGAGQSPPLAWTGVPSGTATLALRVQDVDTAQKFIHWVLYDIPSSTTSLGAGQVPSGALQTKNSFGNPGYGGPCPPAGSKHRYVFTLLALQTGLTISDGEAQAADVWSTLERSAVVGRGELTGTYQRSAS